MVQILRILDVLRHGLAGAGDEVSLDESGVRQLLHHRIDAASPLQILHKRGTRRGQMTQVGGSGIELVHMCKINVNAAFMGNGRQVQHGIGGAAQRHVHDLGIVEGVLGHDITGTDVLAEQLHHLHACLLGKAQTGGVDGGNGAVAPKSHADGLGETVHGVGGVHAGTGAAGGACVHHIFLYAVLIQRARMIRAHCLEHIAEAGSSAVGHMTSQHGTAGHKDGGNIDPRRRHQ